MFIVRECREGGCKQSIHFEGSACSSHCCSEFRAGVLQAALARTNGLNNPLACHRTHVIVAGNNEGDDDRCCTYE